MLSRREFVKKSVGFYALLSAAGSSLFLTGCGIYADIIAWVPIATTAIDSIVTILGSYVSASGAAIIKDIKDFLADLAAVATQYQNDPDPTHKATLLAKIRTLLTDIATNFQTFLADLSLGTNPIIAIVIGLAQIVLAAIAGFLNALPTPTPAPTLSLSAKLGAQTFPVAPKLYKNVGAFKSDWNATCVKFSHPELQLH